MNTRNDILRKHGVIPEKPPSPTPIIQEALEEARKRAHEDRLEDKDLNELDELEDEEDEAFLESYRYPPLRECGHSQSLIACRSKRMAEMATLSKKSVFNQVYPLQKPEYQRDVTDESNNAFVFVHLSSSLASNMESQRLTELWRELAGRFGDVKFCEIRADMCMEGYPERNCPTILIYKDGDIKRQIVTLRELRGHATKANGSF